MRTERHRRGGPGGSRTGRDDTPGERARGRDDRHSRAPNQEHRGSAPDVVMGVEPVRELLAAAPFSIRSLHIRGGDERRFASELEQARAAGVRVERGDDRDLEQLAGRGARHQGIAAEVREYRYVPFEKIIEEQPDPLVVVDGVTDPRNLGALMRSAEGAGVRAVVLARDRTAAVTPAAIKSSAGAWVHLEIARCGNVARALADLKDAGYWIAALAPGGNVSLYELDITRKLALVVGSEDKGVREIVRKTSDFVVDIPMRGKVASLNVSVAAAVALFEVARRRMAVPPSQ